jgi:hypothetical protein
MKILPGERVFYERLVTNLKVPDRKAPVDGGTHMKKIIPFLILTTLVFAACQSPSSSDTGVQTRVAAILTDIPTYTPMPPTVTATIQLPTLAVNTPTEEPTETPTVEPTQGTKEPTATATIPGIPTETLFPSATAPAGDPRAVLGAPTWTDPMDNTNNWPVGSDNFTSLSIADGELALTGLTATNGWKMASAPALKNFYLEADGRMPTCSGMDAWGLYFRVPNYDKPDRGYLFGITCDGNYYLKAWDGTMQPGDMTQIIYPYASKAIQKGPNQINRVGIMANGENLKLYINGKMVHEILDPTYPQGYFGLFINSEKTPNLTAKITDVSYWTSK